MRLAKIYFWEFLQNLPIVAGFIYALELWQLNQNRAALAIIFASSLLGAVTIALTEWKKEPGHHEPMPVLITNALFLVVIMATVILYFSAGWSGWITDLLVGILAGTGLSVVQSWAAKEKVSLRHSFSLGISAPLALLSIRWMVIINLPFVPGVLFVLAPITLIISLIDYASLPVNSQASELDKAVEI